MSKHEKPSDSKTAGDESRPRKLRMTDVARIAGVSPMTVSRALRRSSPVARATREHVLKVIDELGYVPDQIAAGLSSQRSGFIAVLVPSLNNPHFADTVGALQDTLRESELQTLIGHTNYLADQEEKLVETMLRRRPEMVVLTYDGHTPRTRRLLANAEVPVIEIWELPRKPLGHVVGFSNKRAASALTKQLISKGYRKFAFIGETDDKDTRGAARRAGVRDALRDAGLDDGRMLAFAPPPISMSQGARAFTEVMQRWPDTEIVVCVSDPCAFGVQTECQRRGIAIPGDLAVAGFGDFEVSGLAVPAISTVAVSAEEIGRRTGELILELRAAELRGIRLTSQIIEIHASPLEREST